MYSQYQQQSRAPSATDITADLILHRSKLTQVKKEKLYEREFGNILINIEIALRDPHREAYIHKIPRVNTLKLAIYDANECLYHCLTKLREKNFKVYFDPEIFGLIVLLKTETLIQKRHELSLKLLEESEKTQNELAEIKRLITYEH
jgi:hypothetical protein